MQTSPRNIRRYLRGLKAAGYLTITRRPGRSGHYAIGADPDDASEHARFRHSEKIHGASLNIQAAHDCEWKKLAGS